MATGLIHALSSDHCRHLEELYLTGVFKDESIRLVLRSIKDLSFPYMRRFHLGDLDTNQDYSAALGQALKAFPKLEKLVLFRGSIHQSVWEALDAGSCPELIASWTQWSPAQ